MLQGKRVRLRMGLPADAEAAAAYTCENTDHLSRYSPERPPEEATSSFWVERSENDREEFAEDVSCRLLLTIGPEGRVIGTVNLFSFMRGALGPWTRAMPISTTRVV